MLYKKEKDFLSAHKKFSLIFGNDEGKVKLVADAFRKNLGGDILKIHANEFDKDISTVTDALTSESLFSSKQLIILDLCGETLKPKIIKQLVWAIDNHKDSPNDLMILSNQLTKTSPLRKLFESEKTFAVFACYASSQADIAALLESKLSQAGIEISFDAKQLFLQKLSENYARADQEIEKLTIYKNKGEMINFEDIQNLIGEFAEIYLNDLIYASFSGDTAKIEQNLRVLEIEPIPLLLTIRKHLMLLMQINMQARTHRKNTDSVIDELRPPIFFKLKNSLSKQARRWHETKLLKFYTKSLDMEYQQKYIFSNHDNMVKMFLFEIAVAA